MARAVSRILYLFLPVKKGRILFCSFNGMQYTCNPKYIFESLYRRFGQQYEYVWVLNDREKLPMAFRDTVKVVKYRSVRYVYHWMRSGVHINNMGFEPALPNRKKQLYINTWHGGGAYKCVSFDVKMYSKGCKWYCNRIRQLTKNTTDCFLSSSKRFTDVTSEDFRIAENRFVPTGMPRNDRFFSSDPTKTHMLKKQICERHHIDPDNLLVLYAPTFRSYGANLRNPNSDACCPCIENAFETAFGKKVTFLYRRHISRHDTATQPRREHPDIVDLTHYPDMQDLLEIADVLITDYSSSIWDFALTGKPGFLYMPDLAEYQSDRGFYTPLDKWPFPYTESIDGLCRLIVSYNTQENDDRIQAHLNLLVSYERGHAADRVIDIIMRHTR